MGKKNYNYDPKSENIARYLQEIGKVKLLTVDEEFDLTRKIREGDKSALETLVRANLRFVVSIAKQYQNLGLSLDDLINEGNLGLIKAAERFDETKGFKFISYAVWWVRQSIMQAIHEQARLIRLPMNRVTTINKITKANSAFEQDNSRNANVNELAQELNLSEDEIKLAIEISTRTVSLDSQINSNDETNTLIDLITNEDNPTPDHRLKLDSLKKDVENALSILTEKESTILKWYYGISRENSLTLEEIGEILNLTRERVRQIKEKAIRKLRYSEMARDLKIHLG